LKSPPASICSSPAVSLVLQSMAEPGKESDRDHCYQAVAVEMGDTSLCWNIDRGAPKTKCFLLIAAKKNDPGICNEIPDTSDIQAYLPLDCQWEVAMKNNNKAACEAMGNQRISRMFIGEMSRQTCLARLASGQAATGALT
jgi:hypothetical protein